MNPYLNQPPKAFWKTAVADKSMFDVEALWQPKFNITPSDKVVTYGSCFAQHIGRAMQKRGFHWLKTECPPDGLSSDNIKLFNFDCFSSRTGNIYTTSLLKQWVKWALDNDTPPREVWQKDGRFYDPFRPRIEPQGFTSIEEVLLSRRQTTEAFKASIELADYFVFTLGLTESWLNVEHNYEYPMCPGTVAGDYNPQVHKFNNQQFSLVLKNIVNSIDLMRGVNPRLKFILTVSPVPLTATMSGEHVLTATMQSKSILRAVAGQLATNRLYVDYFPSYEIINSPVFKGAFFEPNQRNVNPHGVNLVMEHFFACLKEKYGVLYEEAGNTEAKDSDEVCEEALLEAFGKQ